MAKLEDLQHIEAAATRAPWERQEECIDGPNRGAVAYIAQHGYIETIEIAGEEYSSADANFIVTARNSFKLLLDMAVAARKVCNCTTKTKEDAIKELKLLVQKLG